MEIGDVDVITVDKEIIALLLLGKEFNIVEFMDYFNGKSIPFEYSI